jgi:hypothetical protein
MKKLRRTEIVLLLLLTSATLYAQPVPAVEKDKPAFKLGAFYTSRLHYYGRTDSLGSSGFFPLAELWANKNFYFNAAPVFVMNNLSRFEYAGTVATAGLRLFKDNAYNANIFLVKPLYRENSQLVQSALKWQGAATYTWLNKVINITGGADVKWSDKTDYGATAGLDHIFRCELPGEFVLVLDPTATINAGTQQFTRTAYKKSGFLIFPGIEEQVTEVVNKFSILSYEFSMPVILAKNKFQLILNPGYVIPQNLVRVENRPDLTERGKEMFFVTAGAKLTF